MSAASIKAKAAAKRAAGKGPKNTSYTTADGRGVSIKNGVKTYSDKPVNVKGSSGQSISGRDYSINKGGTGYALTTDQLGTTSPVIPEPPRPDNVGDLLGMNNASVLQEGLTLQGGQFVPDPTASDQMNATREANMNMGNVANSILGYLKPEENQMENAYEDVYGISSREAGRDFRKAQQEVQQYTSQLNTLTASRDAEMLKLEGQGRGQTSGFIGGEQARINREAAIQALPIQAQLAAAQGNLEMAKSHVDSLFQMKLKDIDTMQAYKATVANTFMSVATAQQQNLLNAAIADSNAKAEAKKIAMNDAKSIAMQAIEYGQSSLARSVMSLDPTSPTYQEDVLKMMGQLSKPVAAASSPWKLQDVNGVSSWVNSETQEIKPAEGSGSPEVAQKSLDQFNFLKKTIGEAKDLVDATGPNWITQGLGNILIGNTRVKQLQNKIDSLKTNLLTLNTDPNVKKFFGPQMSNKDTELMLSAGSTLNAYDSSEKANAQELVRYESLINRMEKAVREGLGQELRTFQANPNALNPSISSLFSQPNIITTPDGLQVEIID